MIRGSPNCFPDEICCRPSLSEVRQASHADRHVLCQIDISDFTPGASFFFCFIMGYFVALQ
jgi:hypothetical protein